MVKRWRSVSMLKENLVVLDEFVKQGLYVSRQEVLRDALRHLVQDLRGAHEGGPKRHP